MGVRAKGGMIAGFLKIFNVARYKTRAFERSPRNSAIYLFSDTAFIGRADLIDESEGGAKVSSPTPDILLRARYLFNPDTANVNTLNLAWSSGREAGFQYSGSKRLRGYIDDPKIEHIQTYWNSIAGNHSMDAPRGVFGRAR